MRSLTSALDLIIQFDPTNSAVAVYLVYNYISSIKQQNHTIDIYIDMIHNCMKQWCELFLWNGWLTKDVKPFFEAWPLSEILTIANLQQAVIRVWACAEQVILGFWVLLDIQWFNKMSLESCSLVFVHLIYEKFAHSQILIKKYFIPFDKFSADTNFVQILNQEVFFNTLSIFKYFETISLLICCWRWFCI